MADATHLCRGDDPDLDAVIGPGRAAADRYRRAIARQAGLDETVDWYKHQAEAAHAREAFGEVAAMARRIAWEPLTLLAVLDAANRLTALWRDQPSRKPTYAEIARELTLTAERHAEQLTNARARRAFAQARAREAERTATASSAAATYFNDRKLAHAE